MLFYTNISAFLLWVSHSISNTSSNLFLPTFYLGVSLINSLISFSTFYPFVINEPEQGLYDVYIRACL